MGNVRLLVCCRHLIQGRGQVRALAGAGLAARRACDNYLRLFVFISEIAWKNDYLRKTACVWLCGYDAAFVKLI